jgi:hypothetical protein
MTDAGAAEATTSPTTSSPLTWASWLLRVTAIVGAIAAGVGVLVAPGLRGNATEAAVVFGDRAANTLAYFFCGLLVALLCAGAYELSRAKGVPIAARVIAVGAAGLVVALSAPALVHRLHTPLALALALASSAVALASGVSSLRAPHTRAVGAVLVLLAFAALLRLLGWEIAAAAGERASLPLYNTSRVLATAGFVLEGLAQLVAAAWLGTRGGWTGRLLANGAIVGSFVFTWAAARGSISGAPLWQTVLHSALADAAGAPPPYGLAAIATFLASSAILLALVSALQGGQVIAIVAALSLALVSRGALDVPLRALAAAVAGHWLLLSRADPRSMWTAMNRRRR